MPKFIKIKNESYVNVDLINWVDLREREESGTVAIHFGKQDPVEFWFDDKKDAIEVFNKLILNKENNE